MRTFHGMNLHALRSGAATFYPSEKLRPYVVDALDGLLSDGLLAETLIEEGRGHLLAHAFWLVSIDPDDASPFVYGTDGGTPAAWTSTAALRVRQLLPQDGTLPPNDKIVAFAERGVMTVACLLFVISADGGTSVLYARHPDVAPKAASAMILKAIELTLQKRHPIN